MKLFSSSKKTTYLGVDLGNSNIKMVELGVVDGRPVLKNYGFAERKRGTQNLGDGQALIRYYAELVKHLYTQSGFVSKDVVAALHNFDVFTSVINLPPTSAKQLANVVQTEARKFVPIPLEDVILDWKIIHKHERAGKENSNNKAQRVGKKESKKKDAIIGGDTGGIDVLLTAAPRKLVKRYLDIFRAAELNLLSLETECFAIIRSLLDKPELSSLMLLDIGAVSADIIIVEEQIPVVIRTVDVGGDFITNAIARNLGITEDRAEQFKKDIGISTEDSGDATNKALEQVIEASFSSVINEINYSIDLYRARNRNIEKIILSGGSAWLAGLTDFLKNMFNLPVYIGDPWFKVDYPAALKERLKELGPMYGVGIGLALKEIVE